MAVHDDPHQASSGKGLQPPQSRVRSVIPCCCAPVPLLILPSAGNVMYPFLCLVQWLSSFNVQLEGHFLCEVALISLKEILLSFLCVFKELGMSPSFLCPHNA